MTERVRLWFKRWLIEEEVGENAAKVAMTLVVVFMLAMLIVLGINDPKGLLGLFVWLGSIVAVSWLVVRFSDWISK